MHNESEALELLLLRYGQCLVPRWLDKRRLSLDVQDLYRISSYPYCFALFGLLKVHTSYHQVCTMPLCYCWPQVHVMNLIGWKCDQSPLWMQWDCIAAACPQGTAVPLSALAWGGTKFTPERTVTTKYHTKIHEYIMLQIYMMGSMLLIGWI